MIVVTQSSSLSLMQVARLNGARAILQKSVASGDQLEEAVLKGGAGAKDPKKT